jgi:hypothetical protein
MCFEFIWHPTDVYLFVESYVIKGLSVIVTWSKIVHLTLKTKLPLNLLALYRAIIFLYFLWLNVKVQQSTLSMHFVSFAST